MLQPRLSISITRPGRHVSNPISGEVGAAAQLKNKPENLDNLVFQTPSAGRWVLQHPAKRVAVLGEDSFKPHQRGGGCCSRMISSGRQMSSTTVSNPISGEVCAAAAAFAWALLGWSCMFQTPSAGRWVLQLHRDRLKSAPSFGCFKPHQRGGGCCSDANLPPCRILPHVSNPISGEVGAAAGRSSVWATCLLVGFKPHQRGGGCCSLRTGPSASSHRRVSNPISGEVGAAA